MMGMGFFDAMESNIRGLEALDYIPVSGGWKHLIIFHYPGGWKHLIIVQIHMDAFFLFY